VCAEVRYGGTWTFGPVGGMSVFVSVQVSMLVCVRKCVMEGPGHVGLSEVCQC